MTTELAKNDSGALAQFANNFMFAQQQTQQNFSTFQTSNVSPIGGVLGILPAQAPAQMSFADPMLQPQMDFGFGMPADPYQAGFGMNMGFGDMGGFGMGGGFGEFAPMQPMAGPGYQNQPVYPDPYQPQPGFGAMPMQAPDTGFGMPQPQGWVDPNTTTFQMANNGWDMGQQGNNWAGAGGYQNGMPGMPGMPMMPGMDMQFNGGMNPMAGWNANAEIQGLNGANQMTGKMEVKPKKKK